MQQPTVYISIAGSAIARDERGELVETVDYLPDGRPDWSSAGICDVRGGGGADGYNLLVDAICAAEENAVLLGYNPPVAVPAP